MTSRDLTMLDYDRCYRACRANFKHTFQWGGCAHADPPEPTVSLSKVFTDTDGCPSVGFDNFTEAQLADLIYPALLAAGELPSYADLARAAARAIIHRNDKDGQS